MLARIRLPELLILLLALLTRLWGLDYHSLWFDESVSMTWARSTPDYAWESTFHLVKDKHPPAYYLLLHFWRELLKPVGLENNDVALRLLGSLLGVLTVLGVLLLVNRLSGRPTSLLASALVALSPALVWYSQELRMFQPATTALVWAAYFLLLASTNMQGRRRIGWWLAMVVAFALALYSYLFAAFVLPAAAMVLLGPLVSWFRSRGAPGAQAPSGLRIFVEGALALAITGLIFLPLARNAWLTNANDGMPGTAFMNFNGNLLRQLQVATIWRIDWTAPGLALVMFAILLVTGILLPWRRERSEPSTGTKVMRPAGGDQLYLWAWLGAPLLVGNLLLSRNDTIFAEDRYFLFLVPFVLWGIAAVSLRWANAGSPLVGWQRQQSDSNGRSASTVMEPSHAARRLARRG